MPVSRLSSYQTGVYYSGIKLFNVLPNNISILRTYKNQFRNALQRYLLTDSFYSIDEFIEHTRCTKIEGK
jgi:hypothetical protein